MGWLNQMYRNRRRLGSLFGTQDVFDPSTSILNMKVWLKADTLALGVVTNWTNDAPSSTITFSSTGTHKPVSTAGLLNGLRGVVFDGIDDVITSSASLVSLDKMSLFFVIKTNLLGTLGTLFSDVASEIDLDISDSGNLDFTVNASSTSNTISGVKNVNTPYIIIATYDGSTIGLTINTTSSSPENLTGNVDNQDVMIIGGFNDTIQNLSFTLFEFGAYNQALTSQNISDLYTYLHGKWGV